MLDLINSRKDAIEKKVFEIDDGSPQMAKRYVQIKCNTFQQNNKEKFMLQIIDVSHGIMYDQ